jgi:hypothetical protein
MTIGYALLDYRGEHYYDGQPKQVTKRMAQFMARLEVALGYKPLSLDLPQGCSHNGILSGGTHLKADVGDFEATNYEDKIREGCKLGAIMWHRPYDWDGKGGMEHIHWILRGSEHLSPEAAAQVPDWDKHLDGLYYHRPYNGPWYPVEDFVYQTKPKQPPHKPEYPDMAAEQFRLAALHARTWTDRTVLAANAAKHPKIPALPAALASLDQALPLVKSARMDITHWLNQQGG